MEKQREMFDCRSLDAQFAEYDQKHPEIFEWFERIAMQEKKAGRRRGAKAIIERIRWEVMIPKNDSADPVKVDNKFTSRYVRKLIAKRPEFRTYFELRRLLVA